MVFANLIVQLSILSKLPFISKSRSAWSVTGQDWDPIPLWQSIAVPAYTSMCPMAYLNQREPERSKEG